MGRHTGEEEFVTNGPCGDACMSDVHDLKLVVSGDFFEICWWAVVIFLKFVGDPW